MRLIFTFLLVCLAKCNFLLAQETTSTLSGIVTDAKGDPVPGATIFVKHEPTNFQTGSQSNNKGLFVIPNLKPGGPYTITISFIGYEEQKIENINLSLGNNPDVKFSLKGGEKNLQEVVINSTRRPAGSGLNVERAQLSTLPTLGRSLQDFTRLTP